MFEETAARTDVRKSGIAKLFHQTLKQVQNPPAFCPPQTQTSDLFDLKNFRKDLRSNLSGNPCYPDLRKKEEPGSGADVKPLSRPDHFTQSPGLNEKALTFGIHAHSAKLNSFATLQKQVKTDASPKAARREAVVVGKPREQVEAGRSFGNGLSAQFFASSEALPLGSRDHEAKLGEGRLIQLSNHPDTFRPQTQATGRLQASEQRVRSIQSRLQTDPDETPLKVNGGFLSNISKLKEMNMRGLSAPKEPSRSEARPLSAFADSEQNGFFIKKPLTSNGVGSLGAKLGAHSGLGFERPASAHRSQGLESKRTELKGKLNELLDKLAVNNSSNTRGETRSMMVANNKEQDDNMSLNSFQSTANANKKPMAQTVFTSFYK